eukprot:1483447-Pleurochrysis_carterae.AAC.2
MRTGVVRQAVAKLRRTAFSSATAVAARRSRPGRSHLTCTLHNHAHKKPRDAVVKEMRSDMHA